MSGRIFVVIFFFWACLTIITPTLVHLSEVAKSEHQLLLNGTRSKDEIKARRMMMDYAENNRTNKPKNSMLAPAPGPGPAPEASRKRKAQAYLERVFSEYIGQQLQE